MYRISFNRDGKLFKAIIAVEEYNNEKFTLLDLLNKVSALKADEIVFIEVADQFIEEVQDNDE